MRDGLHSKDRKLGGAWRMAVTRGIAEVGYLWKEENNGRSAWVEGPRARGGVQSENG